jgi:thymidine kinase
MSQISAIVGTMYSGKSSVLIRLYNKCTILDKLMVKHSMTNTTILCSHDNSVVENCHLTNFLLPFVTFTKSKNLFVDEGQFFIDLPEACIYARNNGINIWFSSLLADFRQIIFQNVAETLPYCDIIQLNRCPCVCGDVAVVNMRSKNCDSQDLLLLDDGSNYFISCLKGGCLSRK